MNYNVLIGGSAGQGMDTLSSLFDKILLRKGFETYRTQDYMSRVRGGHNFFQIRFSDQPVEAHSDELDIILALNVDTIHNHIARLKDTGTILGDDSIEYPDKRYLRLPLKDLAKKCGNPMVYGSVALGVLLKLFSQDLEQVETCLNERFHGNIAIQNYKALEEGYLLVASKYDTQRGNRTNLIQISGNESIALGALAAGCKFYSAYPMTPSTSIMTYLASKMEDSCLVVEQAEDEIAAINMAIGASYAGVRAMTGTSGGGFALKVEAVGLSSMLEVPLVIAEIQRPGPTTGLPTRTEQGDLLSVIYSVPGETPKMVIALRNPEDAFKQTVRAFNLADKYQIPVILLGDQYLADTVRTVEKFNLSEVEINRYLSHEEYLGDEEYVRYLVTENGISPRILPGKLEGQLVLVDSDEHDETGHIIEDSETRILMQNKRLRKMRYLADELQEPEFLGDPASEVLLVGFGSLYSTIKEAVALYNDRASDKIGALIFGDVHPLPTALLMEKAAKAKMLIDVEQNATGQLSKLISENTGIQIEHKILKYDGRQLSPSELLSKLKEVIS